MTDHEHIPPTWGVLILLAMFSGYKALGGHDPRVLRAGRILERTVAVLMIVAVVFFVWLIFIWNDPSCPQC